MLPLLRQAQDAEEHHIRKIVERLADHFHLTAEDLAQLLPSGVGGVLRNRVHWARFHLAKAGLLLSTRGGYFRVTDRGKEVLASTPARIDMEYLDRFPEYREFRNASSEPPSQQTTAEGAPTLTPEEAMESGYARLREALASEALQRVKSCSPAFFEKLVVELLVTMGYGGSRTDAGRAIGKSGDEGIDGIIKEDRLGLDVIYLQAKRWERTVGRPDIQQFAGALQGQRARKGVFMTTSGFSSDARDYVARIDSRITLIDGQQLAGLMIDHNVGVSVARNYEVKQIDSDYFSEE